MARVRVRVKETDRGYKRLVREIQKPMVTATVGLQGREGRAKSGDGDATLAEVGTSNEFGTQAGVPERSFLRSTVDAGTPKYLKLMRGVARAAVDGKTTIRKGIGLVGEIVVGDVKQAIANGIPPPNAESTIVAKGSSTPLVNFGQLRGGITKRVKRGKRT